MAKGLTVQEQNVVRDRWYHQLCQLLAENEIEFTRLGSDGLAITDDEADIAIKVVVKKERFDVTAKLQELEAKKLEKLTKEQQKEEKKAKDAIKRQKMEEAKALMEKIRKGELEEAVSSSN